MGNIKWLFLILLFVPLKLFDAQVDNTISDERCKHSLVMHEAETESLAGRKAVLEVLEERMKRSGKSCHVVSLMPKQFSHFSWKVMYETKFSLQEYEKYATMKPVCERCTHFARKDVEVAWMKKFKFRQRVGNHLFFEEVI